MNTTTITTPDQYEHARTVVKAIGRASKSKAYRDGMMDDFRMLGRPEMVATAQRAIDEADRSAP